MRRHLLVLACSGLSLLGAEQVNAAVRVVVTPADGSAPRHRIESPARSKAGNVPDDMFWLPYFEVDGNNPAGVTTLLAVRNHGAQTNRVSFHFFRPDLTSPVTLKATLGPHQTKTVNIRDVAGIPAEPSGFRRGVVIISSDDYLKTLMGDFFRVDPTNNFASGDELFTTAGFCTHWVSRFLNGGSFTGGTTFTFFGPNSTGGTSPIMVGQVYDEAGVLRGTVQIYTADHGYEINTAQLPQAILGTFGTIEWTHQQNRPNIVLATFRASGKYSVGLRAMCVDRLLQ